MSTYQISRTSKITVSEVPAVLWRINVLGRRVEIKGVRYSARYDEPGVVIQAGGNSEAEARNTLAALLANTLDAGLI